MSRPRRRKGFIYDAQGNVVGKTDSTGAGQTQKHQVKTDANRRQNKPRPVKPAKPAQVAADANRSYIPPSKPKGPDPQVLQRQKLLKASGFHQTVDGSWGPKSQTAWQQYQKGIRPLADAKHAAQAAKIARFDKQMHASIDQLRTDATRPGVRRFDPQADAASAPPAAVVRENLRKKMDQAVTGFYTKHYPKASVAMAVRAEKELATEQARQARAKDPKQMTLDDLIALTIDPLTGNLNPRDAADILRVQRWLKAHGHPNLPDSGLWDKQTFSALVDSYQAAKKREIERMHKQITQVVNTVHRLHPEYHIFATPDQLLHDLQSGQSGAKLLWSKLTTLYQDEATMMLASREDAALKLGKEAFGPFADGLFKTPSRQLLRSVQMAYGGLGAGNLAGIEATANSRKELKMLFKQMRAHEQALFDAKAKEAAGDRAWWKGAIDYGLTKPSEFVRTSFWQYHTGLSDVVYGLDEGDWDKIVKGGNAILFGGGFLSAAESTWGKDVTSRKQANLTREHFESDHVWLALAMTLAADPYNFLPGAGFFKARFLALERYGYRLDESNRVVEGWRGLRNAKVAGGVAVTLPARIGRQSTFALRVAGYQHTPDWLKARGVALVRAKSASVSSARAAVNGAMKWHFQPPADIANEFKSDPKVLKELAKFGPDAERHAAVWMKEAYSMFLRGKIPIYSNYDRRELTSVASGLLANFAEYARHITVEQRAVAAGEARRVELKTQKHMSPEQQAEEIADAKKRVREQYGPYIAGAPHPWYGKEVEELVQERMSRFRDVMFPLLQKRLEADFDLAGEKLYDDTGRWIGRGGAEESAFRRLAREAFRGGEDRPRVTLRNPVQGMKFTAAESRELQNQEIGRRLGRLYGWQAREASVGRGKKIEDIEQMAQDIRDEVVGNWQKSRDGTWFDKRDNLIVPDLYARQLKALYEGMDPAEIPDSIKDVIAQVSGKPGEFVTGGIQTELRNLVWAMDSRKEEAALAHKLMWEVHPHLRPSGEFGPPGGRGTFDIEAASEFSDNLNSYAKALGEGWQKHYPAALRKQYAYWYAMSQATGLPMKLAYRGLSGALQLWIFATLPLRPGWAFRNVVDNTAKIIMAGVHDPRLFFLGAEKPGAALKSALEMDFALIGHGVKTMDRMMGTDAHRHWLTVTDMFFDMSGDLLSRIFTTHNIEVPADVLESSLFRPWDDKAHIYNGVSIPPIALRDGSTGEQDENRVRRFQNGVWELMAQRPESYAKRILYRDTYAKAVARMEKDPDFWVYPKNGWNSINIDVGYDRGMLDKVRKDLGLENEEMQFHVNLKDVPPGQEMFEYGSHEMQTINGVPTHVIKVNIPRHLTEGIHTQREAQAVTDYFTGTFLHELKHSKQFNDTINSIVRRLGKGKSTRIPDTRFALRYQMRKIASLHHKLYQALPEEYDARLFERLHTNEYQGLIRLSHESQIAVNALPADTVNRALIERKAFEEAWQAVEKHLFDYSRESTIEDNLRLIFPFVQFWRKNTMLWAEHFVNHPWLPASIYLWQDQLKNNMHKDWPEWSRRYLSAEEVGNSISNVPGLAWLGNYVASQDFMYDPMNFLSFAPMYRAFKNENPQLPADKLGWKFIAPMIDALNDWGLSMNPLLVRKPLEVLGVANYRAWQSIFPETSLVEAFTRKWMNERFPNGLNIEAIVLDPVFQQATQKHIEESFNEYVQLEMANQALRGETPSRARAEKKIQNYYWVQAAVGFFTGAFARRTTPEDFYLYKMAEGFHKGADNYDQMTGKQKQAYRLYKLRKIDPVEFDKYVQAIPLINAYYKLGSWELKEQMKKDHPEIIAWVEPMWAGKGGIPRNYVSMQMLVQDTTFVKQMADLADDLDLPYEVRKYAQDVLVTPALQAFWDSKLTPQKFRDRQMRLLYFQHMSDLNRQFHEIPEKDYDAKKGFLKLNPMLVHFWRQNDSASDEYLGLINSANADLREVYFEYADKEDWDGATKFLHRYPFMFEFTKAADRVDDDGNWIGRSGSGGGSSQHARDFLAAQSSLKVYDSIPKAERNAWLHGGSSDAKIVLAYFAKYSRKRGHGYGLTDHARDFLANKELLLKFFHMKDIDQQFWLEHDGPDQKRIRDYFAKWGSKDGHSEHAKAFLKAKHALDIYHKLPKQKRGVWLHGDSKEAAIALAYFKRWSKLNYIARLWAKLPESRNPELNRRIQFWHKYFSLTPDKRPAYAIAEAEKHGVFIWGPMSKKDRDEREAEYLRKAYAHGASKYAAMFLYVKPLLDEWHKLKDRQAKRTFLEANPELGEYLDKFSKGSATGDPKLDNLMKGYFQLPQGSAERAAYLAKHHKVQLYFDKHSTPAQAAMHRLLEIYFTKIDSKEKKMFLATHPEIGAYFDARKQERTNLQTEGELFGSLDPRLAGLRDYFETDVTHAGTIAQRREQEKRNRKRYVAGLETRRDRKTRF